LLIDSNQQKQKTGVESLVTLYSQIGGFVEFAAQLPNMDGLVSRMWRNFCAQQRLLEALVTLRDQSSNMLTIMSVFEPKALSVSIKVPADKLKEATELLSIQYDGLTQKIQASELNYRLGYNEKPEYIKMMQTTVLMAIGGEQATTNRGGKVQEELENDDWETVS
jgi:hypothetical protein